MDITKIMGGFYGAEIYSPKTATYWWWNGSGWTLGHLPKQLRSGMDECVRRKRENEDADSGE